MDNKMNEPGILLNDSIYHNDVKESSEESETVTLDSYPCSTDDYESIGAILKLPKTSSQLSKYQQQSKQGSSTKTRTTRLPNGILVYISNEIAIGRTDIYKDMQQKAIKDSRVKRKLRYEGNNAVEGKASVRFTNITIREYPYEIGDNPSSLSGPPITIQWQYQYEQIVPIDQYEKLLPERRKGREMLLPADVRTKLLRDTGYSLVQIRKETRNVNITRQQRRQTLAQFQMDHVHELTEKFTRSTLNVLTLGMRKRKEKEYLAQACSYVNLKGKIQL